MHDVRRTLQRRLPVCAIPVALAALAVLSWQVVWVQEKAGAAKWETAIQAFETADRTNPPPQGAILFVGSSSIRLWKTLPEDFAGHKVINRGFGGSEIADSTVFAGRIIVPCKPKWVVLYAGDNDLAAGKSPERVFDDFKVFVARVRAALPQTKVAFISIKPSPSRRQLLEQQKAANELIAGYCKSEGRAEYIDVFHPMLGPDGEPRGDLFLEDKLHLNVQGYRLWREIIRPHLSRTNSFQPRIDTNKHQ